MTNRYYLPIGDWSDDGHGIFEKILIQVDGDENDLFNAHSNIQKTTGLNFESIANHRDEDEITNEQCLLAIEAGLDINKYLEGEDNLNESNIMDLESYYIDYMGMGELWIDLLNLSNENLNIKMIDEGVQMITFTTVGYQLFT